MNGPHREASLHGYESYKGETTRERSWMHIPSHSFSIQLLQELQAGSQSDRRSRATQFAFFFFKKKIQCCIHGEQPSWGKKRRESYSSIIQPASVAVKLLQPCSTTGFSWSQDDLEDNKVVSIFKLVYVLSHA
jgi:hypothetical protein